MGLGVPREALRLVGDPAPRLVTVRSRVDHTEGMLTWTRDKVEQLRSRPRRLHPEEQVPELRDGARPRVHGGRHAIPVGPGLFARTLMDAMPLLVVEEEGRSTIPYCARASSSESSLITAGGSSARPRPPGSPRGLPRPAQAS